MARRRGFILAAAGLIGLLLLTLVVRVTSSEAGQTPPKSCRELRTEIREKYTELSKTKDSKVAKRIKRELEKLGKQYEEQGCSSAGCKKTEIVREVLQDAGFKKGEFVIGEKKFDFSLPEALESGNGRFGPPARTAKALTEWLGSSDPAAKKALTHVREMAGVTKQQAVNPSNWVGVQLLVASEWSGNTLFKDGRVTPAGTRHSATGDIGWILVNPSDCGSGRVNVVRVALIRLGCGNPQTEFPTPHRPGSGGTTTTSSPPTTSTTTPPCVGKECDGKDHTESPVSDDPNDPCEPCRPVIDPPDEVIRPPGSTTTQPPPPSTVPDPPEVQDHEPILPDINDEPHSNEDPAEVCDKNGDGIPDANC